MKKQHKSHKHALHLSALHTSGFDDCRCSCGQFFVPAEECRKHQVAANQAILKAQANWKGHEARSQDKRRGVRKSRPSLQDQREESRSKWEQTANSVSADPMVRLSLLVEWADVVLETVTGSKLKSRRIGHWEYHREATVGDCWVCGRQETLIPHHVVQLQHGGSNRPFNILFICHECHADVHPWMRTNSERDECKPVWA